MKNTVNLFNRDLKVLNGFESKIFPIEKHAYGKGCPLDSYQSQKIKF